MKTYDLPCEACMKTDNHCCTTDIHLNLADAILMMGYAKEMGKDVLIGLHPTADSHMIFMIVPNKPGLDINIEPCIFVGSDGKCEIYEDRPSICRTYGTEHMRCRFEYSNISDEDVIRNCTREDINKLDEAAMDREFSILGKMTRYTREG